MRILFSMLASVGLFLAGLSAFQIRAISDYRARVRDVQSVLAAESMKEVAEAHRRGEVFTGQTLDEVLGPKLEGTDQLESGWFVVTFAGIAVFIISVAGVTWSRTHCQQSPPDTAPEPL